MAVLAATPEAANRKDWIDAMKKVLAEGAKHAASSWSTWFMATIRPRSAMTAPLRWSAAIHTLK